MAVEVASAYVSLIPSARGFGAKADAEIRRELGGVADRQGKQFGDRFSKRALAGLDRFGKRASVMVSAPIVAGFAYAAKAASDLSEAVNKTDVVFGQSAAAIHAFAESSARDLGISRRGAEEAAGTFGNLFVSMQIGAPKAADMSTRLVKLAADLASFNNASPEEALDALRSGLIGETEPLRRFGVNLNDATLRQKALDLGLTTSTKDVLPPAIKAQASYALILEQTKTAQGDFARTSEGAANQQRILRAQLEDTAAEIGSKLLPVATKLIGVVNGVVDAFTDLPEPVQDAALGLLAVLAASGPIAVAITKTTTAARALGKAFEYATLSASSFALAATGVGLGLLGIGALIKGIDEAKKTFKEMGEAVDRDMGKAVNQMALAGDGAKEVAKEAFTAASGIRSMGDAVKADFVGDLTKQGREAKKVLDDLAGSTTVTKERIVQLADSLGINLAKVTDEQRDSLRSAIAELERGVTPTEKLAEAQKVLGDVASTNAEKFDAFKEALDAALGSYLSAEQASIKYQDSIAKLSQSVTENGTQIGTNTEKQRELFGVLLDTVGAASGEVEAMVRSGKISADAATQKQALIDRLTTLRGQFPALAGKIDEYIGHVKAIPDEKTTNVAVTGTEAAIAKLQAFRNAVDAARRFLGLNVTVSGSAKPEGRALGGPVNPGSLYEVTEGGIPELLRQGNRTFLLPGSHGTVIPAADAQATMPAGSSGRPMYLVMPDGRVLAEVVERESYERKLAYR